MSNAPTTLGKYRLLSRVGAGAMGEVWRAEDSGQVRRTVAIKLIATSAGTGESMTRVLLNEARAMASLPQHPNLVTLYDVLELDGLVGLVMEFVEGTGLRERMQRSPQGMPWRDLYPVAQGLMEGLIHAHGHGLIHRDLKPENLKLRTRDLEGAVVAEDLKILDFGLARHDPGHLSTRGEVSGTPRYMSPEQLVGRSQGPMCDQYALGVILFELITGQLPLEAESPGLGGWFEAHRRQPLRSLCALRPDSPPSVEAVVRRALAKAPEDRHPSVGAMASALLPELAHLAQWNRHAWEADGADVTVPLLEALEEPGSPPPATSGPGAPRSTTAPAVAGSSAQSLETYAGTQGDGLATLFERPGPSRAAQPFEARQAKVPLTLAREIQTLWLPADLPAAPGWEAHGSQERSPQAAGDVYGGWGLAHGLLRYAIADVAGAGVGQGLLMAAFLSWMDALAGSSLNPAALLERVSRGLVARAGLRHDLTAVLVDLDPRSGLLRVCNAGHLSPLILRENGAREVVPSHGRPLARLEGDGYGQFETVLHPGDLLVLVTDGVTEADNRDGQAFAMARLEAFLASQRGLALPLLDQALRAEVSRFTGNRERRDDQTVVLIRRSRP